MSSHSQQARSMNTDWETGHATLLHIHVGNDNYWTSSYNHQNHSSKPLRLVCDLDPNRRRVSTRNAPAGCPTLHLPGLCDRQTHERSEMRGPARHSSLFPPLIASRPIHQPASPPRTTSPPRTAPEENSSLIEWGTTPAVMGNSTGAVLTMRTTLPEPGVTR